MKRNYSYVYPTLINRIRTRSLLLVLPALLAAYAVAGAASPALAAGGGGGGTDGTVEVTADSLGSAPGNVVVFTVTLHNGAQAGMVTMYDNLPPHTTLLDAPGCTTNNGGSVSCTFAMFPYDTASATLTVQVDSNANCNGRLRNTARVHGWGQGSSVDVDVACP
jgi:uncharacterized protein DUF11